MNTYIQASATLRGDLHRKTNVGYADHKPTRCSDRKTQRVPRRTRSGTYPRSPAGTSSKSGNHKKLKGIMDTYAKAPK